MLQGVAKCPKKQCKGMKLKQANWKAFVDAGEFDSGNPIRIGIASARTFGRTLDAIGDGDASGACIMSCPSCQGDYLRCEECKHAWQVSNRPKVSAKVKCPECNKKLRAFYGSTDVD